MSATPVAMSAENVVEIKDLAFSYGKREIFKSVNLTIPKGKVVGIMGASGCGKTTLMQLIGAQLRPSKGSVNVLGQDIHSLDRDALYKLRRRMGMQFQQGGLFTDLSVCENIAFQMREKTKLPEDMINDLVLMKLNAVGLRGAAQLMPSECSGGMVRRVGLARAIALDPDLIMYDEPFAGLDPISCNVVGKLIRRLNDALGVTSIVVSYDAQESLKAIDYVYFLADGVVVAQGTTEEVKNSTARPAATVFPRCVRSRDPGGKCVRLSSCRRPPARISPDSRKHAGRWPSPSHRSTKQHP